MANRYHGSDPNSASVTLAKLQNPVKQSFDGVNNDLKEVYKGLNNYSKALDKVVTPLYSLLLHLLMLVGLEIQGQAFTHYRLRCLVITFHVD